METAALLCLLRDGHNRLFTHQPFVPTVLWSVAFFTLSSFLSIIHLLHDCEWMTLFSRYQKYSAVVPYQNQITECVDAFEGFSFSRGGVPWFLYPGPVYIHAKGCHSSPQIPETEKPNFASSKLKTQLCKFSYVFSFTQQSFGR